MSTKRDAADPAQEEQQKRAKVDSADAAAAPATSALPKPAAAYAVSRDGSCPYCQGFTVQHLFKRTKQTSPTVEKLLKLGYAVEMEVAEPSGYCYQCGYGFNFDFGLTSLEEVFAQVLYADPTPIQAYAPQPEEVPVEEPKPEPERTGPAPLFTPKFQEYEVKGHQNKVSGKMERESNDEFLDRNNMPKERDLRHLARYCDVEALSMPAAKAFKPKVKLTRKQVEKFKKKKLERKREKALRDYYAC